MTHERAGIAGIPSLLRRNPILGGGRRAHCHAAAKHTQIRTCLRQLSSATAHSPQAPAAESADGGFAWTVPPSRRPRLCDAFPLRQPWPCDVIGSCLSAAGRRRPPPLPGLLPATSGHFPCPATTSTNTGTATHQASVGCHCIPPGCRSRLPPPHPPYLLSLPGAAPAPGLGSSQHLVTPIACPPAMLACLPPTASRVPAPLLPSAPAPACT